MRPYDLVIPDKTVDKIMGPDPVPQIGIEMEEIQNDLQIKLVQEIACVMCNTFPYMPLECRHCHKILCQYCQIQIHKNPLQAQEDIDIDRMGGDKLAGSPTARRAQAMRMMANNQQQRRSHSPRNIVAGHEIGCPSCKVKGDFLQEVNPIVRNCVDYCEFPHKCNRNTHTVWKAVRDLQKHAQYDECLKYGCDICYL